MPERTSRVWRTETERVDRYEASTYGDALADVYDDWYADVTDTEGTVATVDSLHPGGRVLELGVGTGRIAIPLADAGMTVVGLDASRHMLSRLRGKAGSDLVDSHVGDMSEALPPGPFDAVLATYNTFFNVVEERAQHQVLRLVSDALTPGGSFLVETFVASESSETAGGGITPRIVELDRVVLSVSRRSAGDPRVIDGQFVELTTSGTKLRPWRIRYMLPDELDEAARRAGLALEARWSGWRGEAFGPESDTQIVHYRKPLD